MKARESAVTSNIRQVIKVSRHPNPGADSNGLPAMNKHTTITLLAFTTLLCASTMGCDQGEDIDTELGLDAELQAQILANVEPGFEYPELPEVFTEEEALPTDIAAPEDDAMAVVSLYFGPGEWSWFPTCVLGTQVCVTNPNDSLATYDINKSYVDIAAYSSHCGVWNLGAYGAYFGNSSTSPGLLHLQTSCPNGF